MLFVWMMHGQTNIRYDIYSVHENSLFWSCFIVRCFTPKISSPVELPFKHVYVGFHISIYHVYVLINARFTVFSPFQLSQSTFLGTPHSLSGMSRFRLQLPLPHTFLNVCRKQTQHCQTKVEYSLPHLKLGYTSLILLAA